MHYAASEGRANIVKFMIDNGYRIDAGTEAVYAAAASGDLATMRLLRDREASLSLPDLFGWKKPRRTEELLNAAINGHHHAIDLLLSWGRGVKNILE